MGRIVTDDHFIENDFTGESYAGDHYILDIWGFDTSLKDIHFDKILLDASKIANTTRLYGHVHKFDDGGLSGVAVLEESHITFHTWPKRKYVAFDIFMCGDSRPDLAVKHIIDKLNVEHYEVQIYKRGVK